MRQPPPSASTIPGRCRRPPRSARARPALNACACTVSGLVSSPLARIFTGTPLRVAEALRVQRLERDRGARLEPRLEVEQVDRLRVRAERLERHRLLHVRAAQLAHPHVDRVLAALEPRRGAWRPSASPSPSGRGPTVLPVPDPSPRPTRLRGRARPGRGLQVVQPDPLLAPVSHPRRPRPRWLTFAIMPADLRRVRNLDASARSGAARASAACPSGAGRDPLRDRRCVTSSVLTPRPPQLGAGSDRPARTAPSPPPSRRSPFRDAFGAPIGAVGVAARWRRHRRRPPSSARAPD